MKEKELEFMEKINDLDPELLEDRSAAEKRSRGKLIRRFALAAAAVLLLAGTVYGVAKGIELRKTDSPETEEQGFEAKVQLPLVPRTSFTGEIRTAGEKIAEQYQNPASQPMFSSYYADSGTYARSFETIEEAVAYIGLEDLKTPTFPFDEYDCAVSAHGDEEGRVDVIKLTAEHIVRNDIGAQLYVTILTDAAPQSEYISGGVWTYEFPRDLEFLRYTTPGGNDCAIAVLKPEYDSNYMGLTGYVAAGSALYELNLGAVPTEKNDIAMQMLHDWADALDK